MKIVTIESHGQIRTFEKVISYKVETHDFGLRLEMTFEKNSSPSVTNTYVLFCKKILTALEEERQLLTKKPATIRKKLKKLEKLSTKLKIKS